MWTEKYILQCVGWKKETYINEQIMLSGYEKNRKNRGICAHKLSKKKIEKEIFFLWDVDKYRFPSNLQYKFIV